MWLDDISPTQRNEKEPYKPAWKSLGKREEAEKEETQRRQFLVVIIKEHVSKLGLAAQAYTVRYSRGRIRRTPSSRPS